MLLTPWDKEKDNESHFKIIIGSCYFEPTNQDLIIFTKVFNLKNEKELT